MEDTMTVPMFAAWKVTYTKDQDKVAPITQTALIKQPPPRLPFAPPDSDPIIVHIFARTFENYVRMREHYITTYLEYSRPENGKYMFGEVYTIEVQGKNYLFVWKQLSIAGNPKGDVAIVQDKYVACDYKTYIVKNYNEVVFSVEP